MEKSHGSVLLNEEFLLFFSPRKLVKPGNNNPKIEKFRLLRDVSAILCYVLFEFKGEFAF